MLLMFKVYDFLFTDFGQPKIAEAFIGIFIGGCLSLAVCALTGVLVALVYIFQ